MTVIHYSNSDVRAAEISVFYTVLITNNEFIHYWTEMGGEYCCRKLIALLHLGLILLFSLTVLISFPADAPGRQKEKISYISN